MTYLPPCMLTILFIALTWNGSISLLYNTFLLKDLMGLQRCVCAYEFKLVHVCFISLYLAMSLVNCIFACLRNVLQLLAGYDSRIRACEFRYEAFDAICREDWISRCMIQCYTQRLRRATILHNMRDIIFGNRGPEKTNSALNNIDHE